MQYEQVAAQAESSKKGRLKSETINRLNYSIAEAAHALGVGRSTIYELIASGELESIKLGGRRLIPVDACVALQATYRKRQAA